jgi:outer membrane protein
MKKFIGLVVILVQSSCQQQKIGFVDYAGLMDGYQRKKDIEANYQTKAQAYARKRDSISQSFQIEAQALQARTQDMPQQKAQEEFSTLQQRGQIIGQQLQQEEQFMQQTGQQKMDSLITEVKARIQEYGKANGFTYILAGGDGGTVLYGDQSEDVTEAILKLLNEEYKK